MAKRQTVAKKAVVRPFSDGSYYIHTGSTRRVKYGRDLEAAMRSLENLSAGRARKRLGASDLPLQPAWKVRPGRLSDLGAWTFPQVTQISFTDRYCRRDHCY